MALVSTPAIVLSSMRYGESSKIIRLATEEHGVQSAIAKGALRPRSRFGAALQLLSEGQAHLLLSERRDLHTLTAFDLSRLRVGMSEDLERYAAASVLAEIMLRFAPADPHPVSYHLLREGLDALEASQPDEAPAVALGALWSLVSTLGFEPALDVCVRDGRPIPAGDPLDFSAIDGGALCPECGRNGATRLVPEDRADLAALVRASVPRPVLDPAHAAAHRRLLARYIHHHLAEGANLPALEFWTNRPWMKR